MINHSILRLFLVPALFIAACVGMIQCGEGRGKGHSPTVQASDDSLEIWVRRWGLVLSGLPDSAIIYIDKFLQRSEAKGDYAGVSLAYKARYYYYRGRDNFPETYRSA